MIVTRLYRRGKHKHSALTSQERLTDAAQAHNFQRFNGLPSMP
jgi:hypothetical protein